MLPWIACFVMLLQKNQKKYAKQNIKKNLVSAGGLVIGWRFTCLRTRDYIRVQNVRDGRILVDLRLSLLIDFGRVKNYGSDTDGMHERSKSDAWHASLRGVRTWGVSKLVYTRSLLTSLLGRNVRGP
jgi:hypothetical protein